MQLTWLMAGRTVAADAVAGMATAMPTVVAAPRRMAAYAGSVIFARVQIGYPAMHSVTDCPGASVPMTVTRAPA